jgi:hypothetical protein
MTELSVGKKSCTWYADSHPDDPHWPGWPEYQQKLADRGYVIRDRDQATRKALTRFDTTIEALRSGESVPGGGQ